MFYSCEDSSVRATGRWGMLDGNLTAVAAGSKLEIAFEGKECILQFETFRLQHPMPHLWMQLDNDTRFEVPLDHFLRINCRDGKHILTIVIKSEMEDLHRWHIPLTTGVAFIGYEAEKAGKLPPNNKKTIELIGDSITEGILIDESYRIKNRYDQLNRVYQGDVTATYAYKTALELGLEPLCAAYGKVGTTHAGWGGVPPAPDQYPWCYEDMPVSYDEPDFIMINHGTNDGWGEWPKYFPEAFNRLLNVVTEKNPNSKLIVLTPFNGWLHDEVIEVVDKFNRANNKDIFLVDTKGWIPAEPDHPPRESNDVVVEKLVKILKDKFDL